MHDIILPIALPVAAFAAALVAGVFLTFSDFVMTSLGRSTPVAGAEAMQHINRDVFRSVFMVLLLGSAPLALGLLALAPGAGQAGVWIATGAVTYLGGVMAVTVLANVPMNERLDGFDHRSAEGQGYWRRYHRIWTRWNHVRTVASGVAAAAYMAAALAP